tara:strand:+ start:431 stop:682 length:252 start_codon:yes stop_codon:yes gene_type:complete
MVNAICAVILLLPYTGNTYTISALTTFKFLSPLNKLINSEALNPAHLGVHVPGENAGSNISISSEIYIEDYHLFYKLFYQLFI